MAPNLLQAQGPKHKMNTIGSREKYYRLPGLPPVLLVDGEGLRSRRAELEAKIGDIEGLHQIHGQVDALFLVIFSTMELMDALVHCDGLPVCHLIVVLLDIGQVLWVVAERGVVGIASGALLPVASGLQAVLCRTHDPTGHLRRVNLVITAVMMVVVMWRKEMR